MRRVALDNSGVILKLRLNLSTTDAKLARSNLRPGEPATALLSCRDRLVVFVLVKFRRCVGIEQTGPRASQTRGRPTAKTDH